MRLDDSLDDVFRGRSHAPVLRALFRLPVGIDASIREVARRAGVTHPTASGVLESLRKQGLARRRRTLLADEYCINPSHVLIEPLRALIEVEASVSSSLERSLRDLILDRAPWVREAHLFGSAVDGTMNTDSDIDVAVLCPPRRARGLPRIMEEIGDEIADRYGNRIDVLIGTRSIEELAQPGRSGYRVWQRVVKDGRRFMPLGED
jgi:predicted nucleotidyltransferase